MVTASQAREVTVKVLAKTDDFVRKMGPVGDIAKEVALEITGVAEAIENMGIAAGKHLTRIGATMGAATAGFVTQAGRWQQSFADVAKTVQATGPQLRSVEGDLRQLSRQIPISAGELAQLGSVAGQLGIQAKEIGQFVEVAAQLGVATELSSSQAIVSLSRLMNVTNTAKSAVDELASSLVYLGNVSNTTEGQILDFGQRIAGTANVAGITAQEVLGISSAFTAAGIQAEAGGTAVQRVILEMVQAAATGSDQLSNFARILGTTRQGFKELLEEEPAEAFTQFVEALTAAGEDANLIFGQLGLNSTRLKRAFLSVSQSTESVRQSIDNANQGFDENTALTEEAQKRFNTFFQSLVRLKNVFAEIGRSLGAGFLTPITKLIQVFTELVDLFNKLPSPIKTAIGLFIGIQAATLLVVGTWLKFIRVISLVSLGAFGVNKALDLMKKRNLEVAATGDAATASMTRMQKATGYLKRGLGNISAGLKGIVLGFKDMNLVAAQRSILDMLPRDARGIQTAGQQQLSLFSQRDPIPPIRGKQLSMFDEDFIPIEHQQTFRERMRERAARRATSGRGLLGRGISLFNRIGGKIDPETGQRIQAIPIGAQAASQDVTKLRTGLNRLGRTGLRTMGLLATGFGNLREPIRLVGRGIWALTKGFGRLLTGPVGLLIALPIAIDFFNKMREAADNAYDSATEAADKLAESLNITQQNFASFTPGTDPEASLENFLSQNQNLVSQLGSLGPEGGTGLVLDVLYDLKIHGASDEKLREIVENLKAADVLPRDFEFNFAINFTSQREGASTRTQEQLAGFRTDTLRQYLISEGIPPELADQFISGNYNPDNPETLGRLEDIRNDPFQNINMDPARQIISGYVDSLADRLQGLRGIRDPEEQARQLSALFTEAQSIQGFGETFGVDVADDFIKALDERAGDVTLGLSMREAENVRDVFTQLFDPGRAGTLPDLQEALGEITEELGIADPVAGDYGSMLNQIFDALEDGTIRIEDFNKALSDQRDQFELLTLAGPRYWAAIGVGDQARANQILGQTYQAIFETDPRRALDLVREIWEESKGQATEFGDLAQFSKEEIQGFLNTLMQLEGQSFDFSISGLNEIDRFPILVEKLQRFRDIFGPFAEETQQVQQDVKGLFFSLGNTIIEFERQRRRILQQEQFATEDAATSYQRTLRGIRRNLQRQIRDHRRALFSALDPFDRFSGFRSRRIGTNFLLDNLRRQNEQIGEFTQNLQTLRGRGISQDVLRSLDLTNPQNFQQLKLVLQRSANDPNFIQQLNAAVGERINLLEIFTGDPQNIPDIMQQYNDSVQDAAQSYNDQLDDIATNTQRQLSRIGSEYDLLSVTIEEALSNLSGVANVYLGGIISGFTGIAQALGIEISSEALRSGFLQTGTIDILAELLGLSYGPTGVTPSGNTSLTQRNTTDTDVGAVIDALRNDPEPPGISPITPERPILGTGRVQQSATFYPNNATPSSVAYNSDTSYGPIYVTAEDPLEMKRKLDAYDRRTRLTGGNV